MTESRRATTPETWTAGSGRAESESSGSHEPNGPQRPSRPDRLWPTLIVVGMLVVVAVNAAFIWIAVDGADEVVPSYMEEER